MLTRNTDLVGTRVDRKHLPPQLKKKKAKKDKLNKGERIIFYGKTTNTMVTQWRDKTDVTLMSTCVNDEMVVVTWAGKGGTCCGKLL